MPHRVVDGVPLAHRCRVLPAEALLAELRGQSVEALQMFSSRAAAGSLAAHPGLWKVRRR